MYNPPANRVDDDAMIHELIERARFAHIISHTDDTFASSGLPLLLDRSPAEFGALRGHFARANDQWKALDGASVLALFPLTDGYVTPSRYPSKAEHDRVVPTWNYEVVHAHGIVRIHDDPAWVRQLVSDLTDHHEAARHDLDVALRWAVTDAPPDFIDKQLRAIVGIEIEITRLDGKRKLSQNRSDADRLEVIAGHATSPAERDRALAVAMRETLN
ncbi:FMN-binding negative transcriptional regulator [Ilumatobacter sp.]|uniref:FMN-binding negative transcriptional regulator n=1 Tax=Ilumatobacter sp. TaxID=1967498 RepID=UPI0037534A78